MWKGECGVRRAEGAKGRRRRAEGERGKGRRGEGEGQTGRWGDGGTGGKGEGQKVRR